MFGENDAEREGHRNTRNPRRRIPIPCMGGFFIRINTSGDYINFIHIYSYNKEENERYYSPRSWCSRL
jgi:hypothetical protein